MHRQIHHILISSKICVYLRLLGMCSCIFTDCLVCLQYYKYLLQMMKNKTNKQTKLTNKNFKSKQTQRCHRINFNGSIFVCVNTITMNIVHSIFHSFSHSVFDSRCITPVTMNILLICTQHFFVIRIH